ncbi:FecR family protein [Mucilaginibacter gossypiicola]|nr:FecR family protein [Mucilaginibacter gossypiicola]
MNKAELKTLFAKYNDGTATEEERALLEAWYLQYNEKEAYQLNGKSIKAAKAEIFRRLPGNQGQFFNIGIRLAAAAILIGILFTVTMLFFVNRNPGKASQLANDLPPGTNKAVLTLANGRHLNLSDATNGRLYQQQGIKIVKAQSGQVVFDYSGNQATAEQNTITTPNGGQWQIKLPDGSQVWLNAASSLTFPTSFSHGINRIVKLSGEGYFEVAKDAEHPFIVISGDQRVEVLGTHFNISSYADEPSIKTTLLEGRVKVSLLGNVTPMFLKPGEQSVANGHQLDVKPVDTEEALAWRNGYFQFDDETVSSIMRKLSRWYDVDVRYEGNISDEGLNGRVSRNKNISQVIKALEATQTVHFRLEGRRITVMK